MKANMKFVCVMLENNKDRNRKLYEHEIQKRLN